MVPPEYHEGKHSSSCILTSDMDLALSPEDINLNVQVTLMNLYWRLWREIGVAISFGTDMWRQLGAL